MNDLSERPREHVRALLGQFETAMLVTRCSNGELRSRPMIIADLEGDAELWFVTRIDSGKMHEIAEEAQVNVALSGTRAFVSISGRASVVGDHKLLERLWRDRFFSWFPQGKDDPEITLIRVVPETVEFWDLEGKRGARRVFDAARALLRPLRAKLQRKWLEPGPGVHGTVQLS